ncbi:aldo/keto reductase [Chryseolinea lacunae]|uniref:Aldo/keto reductase n=1 Tax=Chryseolinea lacunae TaxID=2801331 RepID=A0ABS1KMG0_9BACT|nr:aldo/keto reductase [Chryseolinea lacunae]MBL0740636.1 aldo/keto reductase [Chryseolinea lacunae]
MKKVYLSDSGPKVSEAIYSFYRWDGDTSANSAEMEKVVHLCLELGINTFDHADYYSDYSCEEQFGKLIKEKRFKREDLVLFTKCGLRVPHPSQPDIRIRHVDTSAARIRKSIDQSLSKLNTDYIDIFLLDHLDPISSLEETALALEQALKAGKIRNIGVANFSVFQHQLLSAHLQSNVVTHHLELNLLNTPALDNGQMDYIKQKYMRPLASAPVAAGRIASGSDPVAVRVRETLKTYATKYGKDLESIAVAWLIKLGALPLIGTKEEQRIRNIVDAFDIELDHQDWYDIYQATK